MRFLFVLIIWGLGFFTLGKAHYDAAQADVPLNYFMVFLGCTFLFIALMVQLLLKGVRNPQLDEAIANQENQNNSDINNDKIQWYLHPLVWVGLPLFLFSLYKLFTSF